MSQGWKKAFERLFWKNRPSTDTPLNATDMNHIESGIDALDDRIVQLDVLKADAQVVNGMVADVSLNSNTGIITVTYKNGSTKTYDTNLEKIATNFTYDYSTQRLVLTLSDGTTQYVDMSALITQYEFKDSTTIAFSVDSTGKVSASVKNGSITEDMLETGYLANIKVEVAKAEAAASQAQSSETSSDYNAKLSRSYAIGGSGIREGEDTDNAMYYYEQAKKTDIGQIRSEVEELNSNLDTLEFGEVVGGKNKVFGVSYGYINSSGYYFIDGESTSAICYLENGKTYKISCNIKPFAENIRIGKIYSKTPENGTVDNLQQLGKGIDTFTSNFTGYAIVYTHPSKNENVINSIQIEEGTQATDYKPYIPSVKMLAEEVDNVNYSLEDYGLDNKCNSLEQGYATWWDANVEQSPDYIHTDFISVSSGDLVTIKGGLNASHVIFYNASKEFISFETGVNKISVPSGVAFVRANFYGSGITHNNVNIGIYVENQIDVIKNDLSNFKVVAEGDNTISFAVPTTASNIYALFVASGGDDSLSNNALFIVSSLYSKVSVTKIGGDDFTVTYSNDTFTIVFNGVSYFIRSALLRIR